MNFILSDNDSEEYQAYFIVDRINIISKNIECKELEFNIKYKYRIKNFMLVRNKYIKIKKNK